MSRTLLSTEAKQLVGTDDGLELFSFTDSEKRNISVSVEGSRFADLSTFTITAKALPAEGTETSTIGEYTGGTEQALTILNVSGNGFDVRFDAVALATAHPLDPVIGLPVWYYVSVTISTGSGDSEETWEVIRGKINIVKSIV